MKDGMNWQKEWKNDSHKRNKTRNSFNLKTFPVSKNLSLSKRFKIAIWFVTNKKTCFIVERIYATVTTSHSMKHQPRFSQIAVNINLFSFFCWCSGVQARTSFCRFWFTRVREGAQLQKFPTFDVGERKEAESESELKTKWHWTKLKTSSKIQFP